MATLTSSMQPLGRSLLSLAVPAARGAARGAVSRVAARAGLPAASSAAADALGGRRRFILRTLDDVRAAGNVVEAATKTWESRRYLLRSDGCGFSFHQTFLRAGETTLIWYRNHVEAVFIMKGSGTIELVNEDQKQGEGTLHHLNEGSMYCLNGNERHFLRASDDGDMVAVCVFSPPVAGTEDHNEHGVYPAVDDAGTAHYSYGAALVPSLFPVPDALRHGSDPTAAAPAPATAPPLVCDDGVVMRTPTQADGKAMARIVAETTLDDNSTYAYLLAATDFADSSLIAELDGKAAGFVFGYRPPRKPDTLFVWQIGVSPDAAGKGLGGRMLDALADRAAAAPPAAGTATPLRFMEATVTPDNAASRALFTGFARRRSAPLRIEEGAFAADDFDIGSGSAHESEDRFIIGPF
uniref:L-2,4-diaminobutyric acid acetyltransferase n=1 Tax=Bicosoecida sp. CB-2014 TaxID=1486930 RepID=A0A7S1CQ62_9STRA|mmetsp:Transcript_7269/g.25976  ORF Transcript_7269/g.25976 Transcript_7269/m.25976 type:complete len:410 (+) Transcript_7269:32-1261(+)